MKILNEFAGKRILEVREVVGRLDVSTLLSFDDGTFAVLRHMSSSANGPIMKAIEWDNENHLKPFDVHAPSQVEVDCSSEPFDLGNPFGDYVMPNDWTGPADGSKPTPEMLDAVRAGFANSDGVSLEYVSEDNRIDDGARVDDGTGKMVHPSKIKTIKTWASLTKCRHKAEIETK